MNSDAQIDDHGSDANPAGGCSGSNSSHPATTMIGCCDSHLPVRSQSQTPPLQPALTLLSRGASADISRSRRIVASPTSTGFYKWRDNAVHRNASFSAVVLLQ